MSGTRYAGRAALVTGASGFIGSWMVERLLDEGARVIVPRRPSAGRSFLRGGSELEKRCEVVEMDLLSPDSLVRVLNERGVDTVFHLAARTIVGEAQERPLRAFEVNALGTSNLLEACRLLEAQAPHPRVVVASSYHAYGRQEQQCLSEEAPLLPTNPYEVSKACGDLLARCYAATYGAPVGVARLANVYGARDRNLSRLVPGAATSIARDKPPVIRSDGTAERDFIYAADAVDAYLAVADSLENPANSGRAWNAGAGDPVSVADLVRKLIAAAGKDLEPEIRGTADPAAKVDRQYLDSEAIGRELGWRPATSFEDGLEATYGWYAEHLR